MLSADTKNFSEKHNHVENFYGNRSQIHINLDFEAINVEKHVEKLRNVFGFFVENIDLEFYGCGKTGFSTICGKAFGKHFGIKKSDRDAKANGRKNPVQYQISIETVKGIFFSMGYVCVPRMSVPPSMSERTVTEVRFI